MTTQRTLRRKLQKKAKHKPYRKCPKCGGRMVMRLLDDLSPTNIKQVVYRLFKVCGYMGSNRNVVYGNGACGYSEELFWTGGGTGRHIPHGQPAGERPKGCGGSNPSPSIIVEPK